MKKLYSFFVLFTLLFCYTGNVWGGTSPLNIGSNDSSSDYAPLYRTWTDAYFISQQIYSATELSDLEGKQITKITFKLKTVYGNGNAKRIQVRFKEVNYDEFSTASYESIDGATLVHSGDWPTSTSTTIELTLTEPYVYEGGNLLIDVRKVDKVSGDGYGGSSSGKACATYGSKNNVVYNYGSSALPTTCSRSTTRPDISFAYEDVPAGGCKKPKSLAKSAVTHNSATFTWTAGDSETSWQYVYLPAATALTDAAWTGATSGTISTTPTVSLSGLTAETEYKIYVRADCGSEQSADVNLAFKTKCAPIATYSCGFETSEGITNGSYPACWEKISSTGYPQAYNYYSKNGSQCLRFYQAGPQYAVLPPFNQDVKNLEISFWYRNGSYSETIEVGYMTDPEDASTFVSLTTGGSALAHISDYGSSITEVSLSGAAVGAKYIAFKYTASSSWATSYIDDITVSVASSCAKPSALSATSTVYNKGVVSWTNGGEESAWNVRYSTDGETWTTKAATTNPYTLTGLSEQTTYYIQVQANCGGSVSGWSTATAEVTTPCAAQTGVGYTCDFSSPTYSYGNYALPGCWQKIASGNYPYIYNYYARSGQCLYFYGGTSSSTQIAILPPFSENTSDLAIKLYYNNSDYSGASYGSLQVGYMTNPKDSSTFKVVETLAKVNSYTLATVPVMGAPDDAFIALRYIGGSSNGCVFVDDIEIIDAPSCLAPTSVSGSATTYNQASISWTSDASEWKLQYSDDNGTNWTDANSGNSISDNPYTLNGLDGNASYIVRVKAVCGSDESEWSAKSSAFSTPCAPADASDYNETFESSATGGGKLPDCWDYIQSATVYSTTYPYVYSGSSYAYAGSKSLYFYGGLSSSEQIVRLPKMDKAVKNLTVSFYYKNPESQYSTMAKLIVGYIAADGTTFNAIETLNYASDYTFYEKSLSSAASDASYIAIRFAGSASSSASAYIDNLHVEPTPSCRKPTDVEGSNTTTTTAQISWTENNSKSAWKLQYKADGGSWSDAINVTTNPYTLTGLSANTVYYARVMTDCGSGDESAWSDASESFRTTCAAEALPFEEDFNAENPCWTKVSCAANTGLYNNTFRFFYNTTPPQYLISPELEPSAKRVAVEFDYHVSSSAETFHVGYSTTTKETSAFTWSDEISATNTSDLKYNKKLPAGVKFVAIKYTSNDKYYLYIDNFKVSELPDCSVPTDLTASSITANMATISWTAGDEETNWALQYKAEGGSWSDPIAVATTPSYGLTGLSGNILYYVRVKAVCGESKESEYTDGTFSFRTECDYETPTWKENFDSQSTLPACWDNATYTGTQWAIDTYESHSGSHSMRYNGRTYSSYSADLITPSVRISSDDVVLTFWYKNAVTAEVYINDGSSTTKLWDIESSSEWKEKTVDLSSYKDKTVKFIFRGHGYSTSSSKYLYIDDIRVARTVTLADNTDNSLLISSLAAAGETVDVLLSRNLLMDGDYNPLCLPFSLSAAQLADEDCPLSNFKLKVFDYTQEVGDELHLYIAGASSIEAGVPYFVSYQGSPEATKLQHLFRDVKITATTEGTKTHEKVTYQGTFAPTTLADQSSKSENPEILFLGADNTIYYPNTNVNLKGFRAYFTVDYSVGAPARAIRKICFGEQGENTATGIDEVESQKSKVESRKCIENGMLYIIRDGVKYTVLGQKIQ